MERIFNVDEMTSPLTKIRIIILTDEIIYNNLMFLPQKNIDIIVC